jgi:hypothetical protein
MQALKRNDVKAVPTAGGDDAWMRLPERVRDPLYAAPQRPSSGPSASLRAAAAACTTGITRS